MAVRIRLMRMGKIRNPQYRIVVADSRKKRDGRAIENLGLYHPKEDPSRIEVNSERVQHWLSVGAQPSEPVRAILRRTGDWQKFKGLPPPSKPVQVAPPKPDRTAVYEAEAKAAAGLAEAEKKDKSGKAEKGDKGQKAEKSTRAGKAAKGATDKGATDKGAADKGGADKAGEAGNAGETTDARPDAEQGAGPDAAGQPAGKASKRTRAGADGAGAAAGETDAAAEASGNE